MTTQHSMRHGFHLEYSKSFPNQPLFSLHQGHPPLGARQCESSQLWTDLWLQPCEVEASQYVLVTCSKQIYAHNEWQSPWKYLSPLSMISRPLVLSQLPKEISLPPYAIIQRQLRPMLVAFNDFLGICSCFLLTVNLFGFCLAVLPLFTWFAGLNFLSFKQTQFQLGPKV